MLHSFNVEEGFVGTIKALDDRSRILVLFNNQVGKLFPITVGVRQRCRMFPVYLCGENHA